MVDCFDGKVVSWSLSTRLDAELVNTMLDNAVETKCWRTTGDTQ
ncbi:int1 [Escherichia coli DEC5B]|nr:int1 [Escherichia coli DEC5B]